MAKRTAIIDIGSNSISLVVYEKSSRFAFHLIEKARNRVRIGEGAYLRGGYLSQEAMQRAYDTLEDFLSISKSLSCKKILIVATSALRDAPNKKVFLTRVKRGLNLNIKIIDGKKEAYFGGIAALNLLPNIKNATTIDIGGGSTELASIKDGVVVDVISLDIGTVRLKELFFDKNRDFKELEQYIEVELKRVSELFFSSKIVGIGGTIRALSLAILKDTNHPLDSLHSYRYKFSKHKEYIKDISRSEISKLKESSIDRGRYDTIREGSFIFYMLCKKLGAKSIITSKAGVREGVYLNDILRNSNNKFPHNFNISIKNLIDRFAIYHKNIPKVQRDSVNIYLELNHFFDAKSRYLDELKMASKLLLIFRRLNIYSNSDMSFGFLVENLNFGFSHKERLLIAVILRCAFKRDLESKEIKKFKKLLPSVKVIEWLSFILSLALCINKNKRLHKVEIKYIERELLIYGEKESILLSESIKKLKKPSNFSIRFVTNCKK